MYQNVVQIHAVVLKHVLKDHAVDIIQQEGLIVLNAVLSHGQKQVTDIAHLG